MTRYMDTAAEANKVAQQIVEVATDRESPPVTARYVAELVARLYNLGIRTAPHAVQSTVRFNAVRRAVQDLPVKVSMEHRTNPKTHRTYNVLITQPIGGKPTVEGVNEEESE